MQPIISVNLYEAMNWLVNTAKMISQIIPNESN